MYVGPELRRRVYQAKWDALGVKIDLNASCDADVIALELLDTTSTIGPAFRKLSNLETLVHGDARLTKLPPEICKLTKWRERELGDSNGDTSSYRQGDLKMSCTRQESVAS